jgi:hypothetical protein
LYTVPGIFNFAFSQKNRNWFDFELYVQVPMMEGLNKTIEYFALELRRKKHSERNSWMPDFL